MVYNEYTNTNTFHVGETQFILPDGYHEGHLNEVGDINITNGNNSIFFVEYNDTDIDKYIQGYSQYKSENNRSILITNFTIDNTIVYKATNKEDMNIARYFFTNNNKTYSIYNWDSNTELDNIVSNLIKTMGK